MQTSTPIDRKAIYAALAAPFPEDTVQRTWSEDHMGPGGNTIKGTRRGYDTTGIGYQHVVNRLNDVLGVGGYRVERKVTTESGSTNAGKDKHVVHCEIKLQLGEWVGGAWVPFAEAVADGGHESRSLADAIKGAYTNGFKKAAAFFGVGREAYEGTLDDDNVPADTAKDRSGSRSSNPIGEAMRPQPLSDEKLAAKLKVISAMVDAIETVDEQQAVYVQITGLHVEDQQAIMEALHDGWHAKRQATGWQVPAAKPPAASKPAAKGKGGASDPELRFGRSKGKKVSEAETDDLVWMRDKIAESIDDPEKERFIDNNRALLASIDAEIARRG